MITYYELWDLTTRNMIQEWNSYKDPLNLILKDVKAYLTYDDKFSYAIDIFDVKRDSTEYKFRIVWQNVKWFVQCHEELGK